MKKISFRHGFIFTLLVCSIPIFFLVRHYEHLHKFDSTGIGYTLYVTLIFSIVAALLLSVAAWVWQKEPRPLSHRQAQKFYDRFGRKQDSQGFYEDVALEKLIAHASLGEVQNVFELGCGTGRFAARLLAHHLPATAKYLGIDVSQTMIALAQERLQPFAQRAQVIQSSGEIQFPCDDHSMDRVIATYVLDLLSPADIRAVFAEAHRVLEPRGKLCLASLSMGSTAASRLVCNIWSGLYRLHAPLVGGCQPIELEDYFAKEDWTVDFRTKIIQFAIPTELLILTPKI